MKNIIIFSCVTLILNGCILLPKVDNSQPESTGAIITFSQNSSLGPGLWADLSVYSEDLKIIEVFNIMQNRNYDIEHWDANNSYKKVTVVANAKTNEFNGMLVKGRWKITSSNPSDTGGSLNIKWRR